MSTANIHDRASIERLYTRDAFDEDARRNARTDAAIMHGLRVLSGPDDSGNFELVRASRHTGELIDEGGVPFLTPNLAESSAQMAPAQAAGPAAQGSTPLPQTAERRHDYEAFIDRILEVARTTDFEEPIGLHEERLRGFHGG